MGKVIRQCDWCGKAVARYPSQFEDRAHIFCSRECQHRFETKALNPDGYAKNFSKSIAFLRDHAAEFNKHRKAPEVRSKLREARVGTGGGQDVHQISGAAYAQSRSRADAGKAAEI